MKAIFEVGDHVCLPGTAWAGVVFELGGMKTTVSWANEGGKTGGVDTRRLRLVSRPTAHN